MKNEKNLWYKKILKEKIEYFFVFHSMKNAVNLISDIKDF